ncbi:MAG: Clp protease ClpP [Muribaculaceae bacterium]|nr:Clp protease ClpP [Muribaculaceae bacterium]
MENTQYHLHLKGFVGGYDFDRDYVDYVLARNEGKPVHVLIDSLGGSLATALSIASAFKRHGDVSVHFVGMNASAATIASLGAKHISIDASAMYLVHKCSAEFFEWGNLNADQLATVRDNCEAAIRDLNKLDNNVASMYSAKCSKPQSDLLDLMREGGWLTAKEAKEWGFVDEITDLDEAKPVLTDAVASAMAAAGMPIPNVPTESKETLFARFLASIASLFKPSHTEEKEQIVNNQNQSAQMNQSFSLVGKVLNVEGFAVGENGITLTCEQMQQIERALAERDKRNAELAEQLDAVKKSPADTSTAVVNEAKRDTPQPLSEVESYANAFNNAKQLYEQLP